jgi:hypothetical protein
MSTLYLSNVVNNFNEDSDPFNARYLATFNDQQRYNASFSQLKTYILALSATATFGSFWATADWRMIAIKVVGEITLATTGTDPASASISGLIGCYGTSIFPGWLFLNAANLTAASTITSLAADTVVEVFAVTLAADAS